MTLIEYAIDMPAKLLARAGNERRSDGHGWLRPGNPQVYARSVRHKLNSWLEVSGHGIRTEGMT